MERKQMNNQNQQSSDHNSNNSITFFTGSLDSNFSTTDSFDSDSHVSSQYDYISLYMNKLPGIGAVQQRFPISSTPLFQDGSPESLLQETLFSLNRLAINDHGFDWKNFVQNRLPNVENQENLIEGCNFISKGAMTIVGCDELRRVLAAKDRGVKNMIITKVMADLPILMVHQIGFEFAKAVFNSCDELQMAKVLVSLVVENRLGFVHICNNNYGREAVKALIENLKVEIHLLTITYVLEDYICSFTNNKNGQHVLEFFIQACQDDWSRRRLFYAMSKKCVEIATNRLGCIVLQHCICPMYIEAGLLPYLLDGIIRNSAVLAEDKYGNYVVQHVVEACIEDVTKCIVGRLAGRFSGLAKNKMGSNVVERCLEKGEQREVVKIVVELTDSTELLSIAQDPYGNYVLQRALEQALTRGTVEVYQNLVKGINVHSSILKTHLYGRTVSQKIHKLNSRFSFMDKFYSPKCPFPPSNLFI